MGAMRKFSTVSPVLIFGLTLLLSGNAMGAALDVESPSQGEYAAAVLSLIRFNHELCDGLAGRTLGQWQRLGGTADVRLKVLDYLGTEAQDLAQGRAASDIAREFLPGARQEVGNETGSSLTRLHQLARSICDTVVELPPGGIEGLTAEVEQRLDDFEREEAELGRLLVIPEDELEAARRPYLQSIQLAGFEAENEYLDFLEAQKVPERGPTHQELMEAWHREYTAAVAPVREALGKYVKARQQNKFREMSAACREISSSASPLLRNDEIFQLPVRAVPASKGWTRQLLEPLQNAYKEMREMAQNCSAGRSREVQEHLVKMQEELGKAATVLGRFGLQP
jgi:hypothetical protein